MLHWGFISQTGGLYATLGIISQTGNYMPGLVIISKTGDFYDRLAISRADLEFISQTGN